MPIIPLIFQYWRQILAGIGAIVVICAIFYVKHVFNQNEARRIELIEKTAQIENLKAGMAAYLQLNGDIADAISKIKVSSKTVVNQIENTPDPVDGTKFVFMPYSTGLYPKANLAFGGSSSGKGSNR